MNKDRFTDDRATLILLLTSPPCHLKGEVAEASSREPRGYKDLVYSYYYLFHYSIMSRIKRNQRHSLAPEMLRLKTFGIWNGLSDYVRGGVGEYGSILMVLVADQKT
ncbi:hypothetical protein Salat_2161000 [Sesamum alatum]|uniref:Uncharacterized protein n=1 Tax=Sesamum alatum TaxID=300844 RepID=A0AAE1Y1W5_9LAMI|nr:hypothetical protein Salat_2161000 [Sesamum alatum]